MELNEKTGMTLIDDRIREVFREIFDDPNMVISDEVSANDVPEWDSLAQVKLIIGMEEEFEIKFSTHDITQMTSVGDFKKFLILKGVAC